MGAKENLCEVPEIDEDDIAEEETEHLMTEEEASEMHEAFSSGVSQGPVQGDHEGSGSGI